MNGFLYFFPGLTSVDQVDFSGLGLGRSLGRVGDVSGESVLGNIVFGVTQTGPTGVAGLMVRLKGEGARMGYRRDDQTWRVCNGQLTMNNEQNQENIRGKEHPLESPLEGGLENGSAGASPARGGDTGKDRDSPGASLGTVPGKFHIGWWNDERPGAVDLERGAGEFVDGYGLDLPGGRWAAPLARDADEGMRLPCTYGIDEYGRFADVVDVRYVSLWELAVHVGGALDSESLSITLDEGEAYRAAVMALNTNYHVGDWELRALGVLTPSSVKGILLALIDGPALFEMVQKKTAYVK